METNRLRQFCTIVETQNLRKAADLLGISHSGLSKSMRTFQDEIGLSLFLPSGRGLVITDQGRELYQRAQPFFAEFSRLLKQTDSAKAEVFRIGSFEVFTSYLMGPLVKNHLSDLELEIHELVPGRLEEALALNRVDIGITYDPVPRSGIEYSKILSIRMGAYARAGCEFAHFPLKDIPFVVPVNPLEGAPSGARGLDAWPEREYHRNVRYRVDLMATGLALARQGLCAIYIPDFVARLHNKETPSEGKLHALEMPKAVNSIRRDVYLVKRESMIEDRLVKRITKAIRQLCASD